MNALFRAASDFQAFCAARGWSCCVIGGLAVQRWGEPRQTRDVDLTLVRAGLEALVARESARRLADLGGSDKAARAVRRRRSPTKRARA